MRKYVAYSQRNQVFEAALKRFARYCGLTRLQVKRLESALRTVPSLIHYAERNLWLRGYGLPTELLHESFQQDVAIALKVAGIWKQFSRKQKDVYRKRLKANFSTIDKNTGPMPYPYIGLEDQYKLHIIEAMAIGTRHSNRQPFIRPLPVSRSRASISSNSTIPGGPPFDLLHAALDLALPFTGAPGKAGLEKRLSEK